MKGRNGRQIGRDCVRERARERKREKEAKDETVWGETNKRNFLADPPRYDSHIPRFVRAHMHARMRGGVYTLAYVPYAPVTSIYFTIGCVRATRDKAKGRLKTLIRQARGDAFTALRVNKIKKVCVALRGICFSSRIFLPMAKSMETRA